MLELEADFLRERVMESKSSSLIDKRMNIKVDSLNEYENKSYLKVSRGCKEVFLFKIKEDKGKRVGEQIEGPIMDGEPGRNADDTVYIIESAKLRNPTLTTLKMLNRAKVVISDPRGNYDDIIKRL